MTPTTPNHELLHSEKQARLSLIIQLIGVVGILILAGFVLWAAVTGSERNREKLSQQVQIDFELAKAEICAIAGLLSLPTDQRADVVQEIVDMCLSQADLGDTEINVPSGAGSE